MKPGKFSIKSRSRSFKFAFIGLSSLIRNEHNARIHLFAAIMAVAAGIILKIDLIEWCLITIVTGLVFLTELINTSIETLSDRFHPDPDDSIMLAKDYAAAAVLISAIIAVIVGILIFLPRVIDQF